MRNVEDHLVSKQFRRLKAPAFCAVCADEHGYIERIWDLAAVQACPLHGCWAVTHCLSCGLPAYWERGSLTHCPCGAPYTDSVRTDAPPTLVLASAELILRASTYRQGPGYPEQLGFPAELWALSLRSTLRLQEDLARLVRIVEPDIANSLGIAVSGKALEQWPASFISLLETYRVAKGAEAVTSLLFDRKTGLFSRYQFANARPGQCLSFLAEAVFDFLNGDAPVFVDPRVQSHLFGKRRGRWYSLSRVSLTLGIGMQKLNQLADKGQVAPVVGAAPCRRLVDPACITEDQVRALFQVNFRDASKATGLPVDTLKTSLKDHVFGTFRQHRGITLGEIECIRQALAEGAARTPVCEGRRSRFSGRTMGELLDSSRYSTAFKAASVRHLVDGRLVAMARQGDSFRDLVLDVDELIVALGGMRTKPIHYLEATVVAQMLWCSTMAVRELVKKGYLQESEHGHRHKIATSSCRQFQHEYISAREVGDVLGWSQRRLVHAFGALRCPPMLLRLTQRAGWFVKRSSLPEVGLLAEQLLCHD